MPRVTHLLCHVLLGAIISFSVAAATTYLNSPIDHFAFNTHFIRGRFRVTQESQWPSMTFVQRERIGLTEIHAWIGELDDCSLGDDHRTPPLKYYERTDLDAWCITALHPWLSGERPWPSGQPGDVDSCKTINAGWPLRAFSCRQMSPLSSASGAFFSGSVRLGDGIEIKRKPFQIVSIPFRPLWPGFLFNTALFAAIGFALHLTFQSLARRSRRRNNRCPKCNYTLTGLTSTTCPECGTPATP